jgi:hypothetical protein
MWLSFPFSPSLASVSRLAVKSKDKFLVHWVRFSGKHRKTPQRVLAKQGS